MTDTITREKVDQVQIIQREHKEAAKTEPKGDQGNRISYGRTAGVLCHDSVKVGSETIEGESEPRYDPVYERQQISLGRRGSRVTNVEALKFEGSIVWSGPVLYVVLYDEQGKEAGRSQFEGQPGWPPEFPSESLNFKGKAEFE